MKNYFRLFFRRFFVCAGRTKQYLVFVCCLLITIGFVMLPGEMAQAAELSPKGQESFNRGMVAAQQQDFKLALRYFLDAQEADPDAPQIWFNLGLASSKLPGYELRALAWFQAYLMKVPDAPNADAIRKQIGAIEVAFESKMGKILDQLSLLIETNQSDNSVYRGLNIALARGYLGDFEGMGKELKKFTGKTTWQDALIRFPEKELLWNPDRIFGMIRKGQIEYLLDLGVNGTRSYFGFNDTQFYDSLRYIKEQDLRPSAGLTAVLSDVAGLSASYRVISGRFDPGPHSDPYWAEHYSKAMYELGDSIAIFSKDYPKAIEYYNKAIALNPKSIEAYSGRGRVYYFALEDYPRAIADYTKAIELDPKDVLAYISRGDAYNKKEQYDQAIADYTKAIELDPKYVFAYDSRGAYYSNKGQYDQAIADYTKAIELDPKDVFAYNNRGLAYKNKAQYDQAIADYTKAIELDPKYANAYYNRGNNYSNKGQYDQAIADYTKVIELDPKYVFAYIKRGVAYDNKGQYAQAIADYTKVIELDPKYVFAYDRRGLAYNNKEQYDQAIADYTKVIELDPKYVNAYINRGVAYYNKRQYDQAIADYTKAIELDPKNTLASDNRDIAYRNKKELIKSKPADSAIAPKKASLKKYTYQGRQIELAREQVFDITGKVESARATLSYNKSDYSVVVDLKNNAKKALEDFSVQNIGKKTGLFYKFNLVFIAVLREPLTGGNFEINGKYTYEEAKKLASELTGK